MEKRILTNENKIQIFNEVCCPSATFYNNEPTLTFRTGEGQKDFKTAMLGDVIYRKPNGYFDIKRRK